jgi:hypothetical protein
MSSNVSSTERDSGGSARRGKKSRGETPAAKARRLIEASNLHAYLRDLGLPVQPTIHINGPAFASAVVVVDFGQPLEPIKLTDDENAEVTEYLRQLTRTVIGKNINLPVEVDTKNGLVYWSKLP